MSLMFIGYKVINVFRINRKIDVMLSSIEKVILFSLTFLGYDTCPCFRILYRNSNDWHDNHCFKHLGSLYGWIQKFLRCLLGDLFPAYGTLKFRIYAILQRILVFRICNNIHYFRDLHSALLIYDFLYRLIQKSDAAAWATPVITWSILGCTLEAWSF
jgi:hypothetical protein